METVYCRKIQHLQLQFKSYYVVWKLFEVSIYCSAISSLNRTMQYGNVPISMVFSEIKCGLNRTMQYGNRISKIEFQRQTGRLNRTMQYGNYFPTAISFVTAILFKSYYVVWKRKKIIDIENIKESLNRTMQYGNFFLPAWELRPRSLV